MKGSGSPMSSCCNILSRRSRRYDKKKLFLFLAIFIPAFGYFNYQYNWPVMHVFLNGDIKSPCVIPKYDPYDASISNFFWHPDPINCEAWKNLVYVDSSGVLHVNETAVSNSGYSGVRCGYSPIKHVNDTVVDIAAEVTYNLPSFMSTEYFRVMCKDKSDSVVYHYIHYNINYEKRRNHYKYKEETEDHLSVYIFGLDSVSRLLAERKLKKTFKYMREELGAFMLNGYTKVGDNSFPNLVAFLTGLQAFSKEWNFSGIGKVPFIWNNFTSNGYVDLFLEDWPEIATFNGFPVPPTHHYIRSFLLAMHKIRPAIRTMEKVLMFLEHRNIKVNDISPLCYGNIPKHLLIMKYYRDFIQHYGNKLKFAFSWFNELTHDLINFTELIDDDLFNFLKSLKENGRLKNAVFILFSDHGPRYSEIQNTAIGRVTDMMPMASIILPPHFKHKHPHLYKNLKINTNRLTTHYDMFETLKDILHKNFEPRELLDDNSRLPRGFSLFQEIPEKRSCFDASIPENYCPCYSAHNISVEDKKVKKVAQFLVDEMNKALSKELPSKCAKLKLANIKNAEEIKVNLQRAPEKEEYFSFRSYLYRNVDESARYMVVLETTPCGGLFEGTVEYKTHGKMKVLGNINRINRYNDQSKCVSDRLSRLYCCCN